MNILILSLLLFNKLQKVFKSHFYSFNRTLRETHLNKWMEKILKEKWNNQFTHQKSQTKRFIWFNKTKHKVVVYFTLYEIQLKNRQKLSLEHRKWHFLFHASSLSLFYFLSTLFLFKFFLFFYSSVHKLFNLLLSIRVPNTYVIRWPKIN